MDTLTIIILIILAVAAVMGFMSGFMKQLGSLAGTIIGIIVCRIYGPGVAAWAVNPSDTPAMQTLYTVLAYVALFLVAYLAVWLVARLARKLLDALHIGIVDRLAGAVLKVAIWCFFMSLIYNLCVSVNILSAPTVAQIWHYRLLNFAPTIIGMV